MSTRLSDRVRVATTSSAQRAVLAVATDEGPVRFELDASDARLRLGILLRERTRPIDVTNQPRVLIAALGDTDADPTEDVRAVCAWLDGFSAHHDLWRDPRVDLTRTLTGASFPLLARMYEGGAATLQDVPRWAAPALIESTVRAATTAVLAPVASRTVVAALGSALTPRADPPRPPALHVLALALMGSGVLASDAVARVLRAAGPEGPPPPPTWPTVDEVARFRGMAGVLGTRRVERVLTDAATLPDGPRLLARTAVLLEGIPAGARLRLPQGLGALHRRCLELTPLDPRPHRPEAPAAPAAAPRPRVRVPREALMAPPTVGRAPRAADPLSYPATVARVHGRAAGPHLRLVLPRSTFELREWGQRMHNCLGSFAAAVASGRSLVVGVERRDVLAYCAELVPSSRTMRQLHGSHNHAVPGRDAAAICAALVEVGLLDPAQPVNRPWVELCRSMAGS
ncbi:MAG: PcfJ domain-containing protein [Microthrixaceae bacterium]